MSDRPIDFAAISKAIAVELLEARLLDAEDVRLIVAMQEAVERGVDVGLRVAQARRVRC